MSGTVMTDFVPAKVVPAPLAPPRLAPPTYADVEAARKRIAPHLAPTPLHNYPSLDAVLGFEAWVKHENHQPVGAFKVRGGVNLIARLPEAERKAGVIGASTGNHGQSIAWAARRFGVKATIVVPKGANPAKMEAMRSFGATLVEHGTSFDEARLHAADVAKRSGARYIHSGDEPDLIAGVGTYAAEMLDAQPDLDTILVPVGGGSGAAGCCVVAGHRKPGLQVIGVQSAQAPAAYESWRQRKPVEVASKTWAEGLATGAPFDLPQSILRGEHGARGLTDFVLVSDDEIRAAVLLLLEKTRNLAEGAGAAATAAAMQLRSRLKGRKVGIILSGGNLSMDQLRELLTSAAPPASATTSRWSATDRR